MAKQGALRRFACTFGSGDFGRLVHGTNEPELVPRIVAQLAGKHVKQAAAGGAHTVIVTEDGEVWTGGLNDAGQLGHSHSAESVPSLQRVDLPDPVTAVTAGHYHTLALTTAGELWVWGRNAAGQLGIGGKSKSDERTPLRVEPLQGTRIAAIAAGAEHSLAVTSDAGEVFAWGSPAGGRLGARPERWLLNSGRQSEPRLVRGLVGVRAWTVQCGHQHSAAIDMDGQAYLWGSNRFSQLGLEKDQEQPHPTPVRQLPNIMSIALGGLHSVAVSGSGQVLSWGANQNGLLGLGAAAEQSVPTPTPIPGVFGAHVTAGWKHNAAITPAGELLTWGWGGSAGSQSAYDSSASTGGQLGRGNESDCWVPTIVPEIAAADGRVVRQRDSEDGGATLAWRVLQVSAGFNHTTITVEADESLAEGATT